MGEQPSAAPRRTEALSLCGARKSVDRILRNVALNRVRPVALFICHGIPGPLPPMVRLPACSHTGSFSNDFRRHEDAKLELFEARHPRRRFGAPQARGTFA